MSPNHPINQAAIDFVQTLMAPEYAVRVVCCRRDLTQMPLGYYSTAPLTLLGYTYCFWLSEGHEQLLIHVKGFGVFGATYQDAWPIILSMGLNQSFAQAA